MQDLRAKIFPLKRKKVKAPGSISVPVYSSMEEYASEHVFPSFIQEFSRVDSEQGTMLSKSCALTSYMGLHFLFQESEKLKKELAMVSDKLLASEEGLKKLEAEGKLAQERVKEIDSLSWKLAVKEEELRTKEKELEILRMLAQAKSEEAAEIKVRLDQVTAEEEALRRVTSPSSTPLGSVAPSGQWVSLEDYQKLALEKEELKKDMDLIELATKIVMGYQMCLRWEKKCGLDRELSVMANKQYWQYRDLVEKEGKSDCFPSLETYKKDWEEDEVHASPQTSHSEKAPYGVTERGLIPLPIELIPPPVKSGSRNHFYSVQN